MTISWPPSPFTLADLREQDISESARRGALAAGEVRRVLRGVFAEADVPDTLDFRARCLARVVRPHHVITDRTAAWLHGVDVHTSAELTDLPPLETCALRGRRPTSLTGVDGRSRDLLPADVTNVQGLRVTTPLRTALDLGCCLRRREAYAALNAFARTFGLTRQDYLRSIGRYRGRRGVVQLRELVAFVDPRHESPRESWVYLEIGARGLPLPEPQVWVEIDVGISYRLDFAYPDSLVCVEYDGFEDHDRTREQQERDEARRRDLRALGWIVIVVKCGDFTDVRLDRWIGQLRDALHLRAVTPYSPRRW
ncbi:hypothetical protein [Nocardioides mangrovi]|uniref:DUF559 domain-containing protein n=1 Tax=Nocardioides mangrovi TaxID=2874580 RepID=A0ABS7UJD4_9ACTN|nr:hypothetical protein [Nocardioides mangrovi]MBZ5740882.1 hypothetical protein [Nocardioides mangrovi]